MTKPYTLSHEHIRVIGVRTVEHMMKMIKEHKKKHDNMTRGEKIILRDLGPLLFLQGHIWTLDNVALQDDPRCLILEKHLRTFIDRYMGAGDVIVYEEDCLEAVKYLQELDASRKPAEIEVDK